jgi:hypothetical protein
MRFVTIDLHCFIHFIYAAREYDRAARAAGVMVGVNVPAGLF